VGFLEALALRVVEALARAWRLRPVSKRRRIVRNARKDGKALLKDVRLALPGDSRALKALWGQTIRWWGDFEVGLDAADPLLYERFRSPVMERPGTSAELAEGIEDKLATLGRIERYLVWPVPLQRFLRV
jgi:hypothetical protein